MTQRQTTAQKKARALTKANANIRYTDALVQVSARTTRAARLPRISPDAYRVAVGVTQFVEAQRAMTARMMAPIIKAQNLRIAAVVQPVRVQPIAAVRVPTPVLDLQLKFASYVEAQQKVAAKMMEPFFAAQYAALMQRVGPHLPSRVRSAS